LGREIIMVRKIVTLALVAGTLAVAGCNTVAGMGKDVESVGETAQDAAK
jgi:predicted small secreted protein